MPAAAQGTSPAAAKAFVRHYFDTINYAAATGDTGALRSLGTEECVSCEAIATNIERIYRSGGRMDSHGWTVRLVRSIKTTADRAVLSVGVFLEREVVVDAEGGVDVHDGKRQPMTIHLRGEPDAYVVTKLDLVT